MVEKNHRHGWLISPFWDLTFLIGSPFWSLLFVVFLSKYFPPEMVLAGILGFLATGHHIPSFTRAYGEKEFVRDNWVGVVFNPLFIAILFLGFGYQGSPVFELIFLWDIYHFLMQYFGLSRMYLAKNGLDSNFRKIPLLNRNLDFWTCCSWYLAIVFNSQYHRYIAIDHFFKVGIQFPDWIYIYPSTLFSILALFFLFIFIVEVIQTGQRKGYIPLPIILFHGSNLIAWSFAFLYFNDPLLSYAMASVFHATQAFVITDHFQNCLIQRKKASEFTGWFLFLFDRPGHFKILVFLSFFYGGLMWLFSEKWAEIGKYLYIYSAVMHYYLDSFIWKISKPSIGLGLGLPFPGELEGVKS